MKLIVATLLLFSAFGCSKPNTQVEATNDTTNMVEQVDSLGTDIQPSAEEVGYGIDTYLANQSLDTSEFQIVSKSYAIFIEETVAQRDARYEEEQKEQNLKHTEWEKAKAEWQKQHDSTDLFEDEENYFESEEASDGAYYRFKAQDILDELKIDTITVRKKGFVRLIDKNKKKWTLDIRSSMTPDWTIILFNVQKEPRVLEAIDVTKEGMIQYFLMQPPTQQEQTKFNSGEIAGEFVMAIGDCTPYCRVRVTGDNMVLDGIDYSGSKTIRYSETYIRSLTDKFTFNFPKDSNVQIKLLSQNEFTFTNTRGSCTFYKIKE